MTEQELAKELWQAGRSTCPHQLLPVILQMIENERKSIIDYCDKRGEHMLALDLKMKKDYE